ncbi:MAG TPA: hypothetical protein VLB29_01615 [Nocardioidaceae bacterium]|nr:hypothetical protein [Nocardioidaceae bacterium]
MSRSRHALPMTLLVALIVSAAAGIPGAVAAPPKLSPASSATCTTPRSPDGHEPPCNPALAQSPWAAAHRNSYAQASSPMVGPRPQDRVEVQQIRLVPDGVGVPVVHEVSERYPDGRRVVWASVISTPENQGVFKVDERTGQVIDFLAEPSGRLSSSSSGAYSVLDRDGHLIVAHQQSLDVYGDAVPGRRTSRIKKLRSLDLGRVLCREDDRIVGITMLYDGMVAFATELGVVGVVPRQPRRMRPANLRTLSQNGAACADTGVDRSELEQVSNSIAADERGGIYVVTSKAQYKYRWNGQRLRRTWRAAYETGGVQGGARLGAGSGSTPSLMGTRRGDDKFVVVTDGRRLMRLVLMWRDKIPADWKPIAKGKDRRIACEVPVRFGDPEREESVSEQSVLVRGNSVVLVDNTHALDPAYAAAPEQVRPFSVIADQAEPNAPHGIERIDWRPRSRTCRVRWANPEVSMPNGIPTMSVRSGLIYDVGLHDGVWGLSGVDFRTGKERLFVPSSAEPFENSFFAASQIGPRGAVWTGNLHGLTVFRPRKR